MSDWLILAVAVALWFVLVIVFEAHRMRHDDE